MNNIYLIGFMAAGKTSAAKAFLELQSKNNLTGSPSPTELHPDSNAEMLPAFDTTSALPQVFDTDAEIISKTGMSISDFFQEHGEAEFRRLETCILRELSNNNNALISTGGGIIKDSNNIRLMKSTGIIVYLSIEAETAISRTKSDKSRPLLKSPEDIRRLLKERKDIYEKSADIIIKNDNKTPYETAKIIKSLFENRQPF